MKCKKCGKLIDDNLLYCKFCGTEVQVVPEYNKIEEELNESIRFLQKETNDETVVSKVYHPAQKINSVSIRNNELQDELESEKKRIIEELDYEREQRLLRQTNEEQADTKEHMQNRPQRNRKELFAAENSSVNNGNAEDVNENAEEEWQEFRLEKKADSPKQKKMKLMASIVGLSFFIVVSVIGIIVFLIMKGQNYSFNTQYRAAASYWKAGNYEKAVIAYEKAIQAADSAEDKLSANKELARLYIEYGDTDNAIYYLEAAIDADSTDAESVKLLVGLYEEKNDSASIRKLAEKASSDDTVALFEKYLLNQPVFNYKSGTYNELLTVDITSADGEVIYYTMDGTVPTAQSTPYSQPLSVGEGTTVIHAITINSKGYISEEVVVTYNVKLDVPPAPVITPDSGKYSEASKVTITNIPTNCKVYYTMDGSVPTDKSAEYTGPFDMLLGNYVVSVISINQYTGGSSEVVSKVFELNISGKVAWTESGARVLAKLQKDGKVADLAGNMTDGDICLPVVQTTAEIGKEKYYIVKCYRRKGEALSDLNWFYAVSVSTGEVYTALPNGAGQYNLSP